MCGIADVTIAAETEMPRLEDGFIDLQEVCCQLAERVVNEIMSAETYQCFCQLIVPKWGCGGGLGPR